MSRNSITSMTSNESTIIVNGKVYTQSEYKKYLKEKGIIKPKKKVKKELTDIQNQTIDIKGLMREARLLKSFDAYYHNGYRQWGRIAKDVIHGNEDIRKPFVRFVAKYDEVEAIMNELEKIGMKSEKAVYQYMETLGYRLDDIIEILKDLSHAISRNDILGRFGNHKFVNETGRRLGLRELMSRVCNAVCKMQMIIIQCGAYSTQGIDAFEYTTKSLNGMLSCWSGNER